MSAPLGLYIHIPFCDGKCPYCDFYSVRPDDTLRDGYTSALISDMRRFAAQNGRQTADTIYIGGGTPPQIGGARLVRIIEEAYAQFEITPDAEITVEVNPRNVTAELIACLRSAGVNRISMGVQSGVDEELAALGRRHTATDAAHAAELIRAGGIDNISLDLMLAIPGQNERSLEQSISFLASLRPRHISAYLLKLEEGTPFYAKRGSMDLPDDDGQADMYMSACDLIEASGYEQYEISNFAQKGYESRHNLKYWSCDEYLGFGASAHSFYMGKRYYYLRDIAQYIKAPATVADGTGGDREEYAMLRLRLRDGIKREEWSKRFGEPLPRSITDKSAALERAGLMKCDACGVRLTRSGMLLSNAVISAALEKI